MSYHKKFANKGHEDAAMLTTSYVSRHGLSKIQKRVKRFYRKLGTRAEARQSFTDQNE